MPRRKTLTDAQIAAFKPGHRPNPVPDPELTGHYVRIHDSGNKSFITGTRAPGGKQKWKVIGSTKLYTVEQSRERARVILIATREGKSGPESFPATAKTWFKRHVEAKGIISASEIRSYLDRFLLPAWDGREFASIRRSDIAALLDKIEDTHGAVVADAVLTVIRMICNWYETRNEDYTSPIVKGMRRSNPKERARTRKLNDDELREVWRVAEANGVFGSFVRVALLTAQRREKILAMKWDDLDAGEWTIPQAKREKGTAGSLMLPQMALDIINAQPRLLSNDYVFAGQGSGYIQAIGKRKAALDSKMTGVAHYTLHDLRRTARSLMSRAGVRPEIAERVLGHAQDAIEGIYDRHDYSAEKAEALQKLADLIQVIVTDI